MSRPERCPHLPGPGYRDYDETALARLCFVRAAQAAGLTLAEIRTVIKVREDVGPPCQHVTDLLAGHAAALDERIAELGTTLTEVRRLRDRATALDPKACREDGVCHVIPPG